MRHVAVFAGAWFVCQAHAVVFINEAVFNPLGSLDDTREYIELQGTPGMKLDGYAVAFLNGTEEKYYPRGSIPPLPVPTPEIDEFFSLDGLSLGANGLLVLAIANRGFFPEVLDDTTFVGPWTSRWNGQLDIPGKLQNDGSNTILIIRNRPGATQARPGAVSELRWAKGLWQDFEIIRGVVDPQDNVTKDQFGDGTLDRGQPSGLGNARALDMKGASTPANLADDLEVVDEVSYEHGRGWEYDIDGRKVDVGSQSNAFPDRRVHALDDPEDFNPDSLTRVDYRTSGPGWRPASGGQGQMTNGNNWQDTATEQWIRGETTAIIGDDGPELYYDNAPVMNPGAIQPFKTNVPLWLADGMGMDYRFQELDTYAIQAGRVNSLAIPFIPGDVDRDGDCDEQDIDKIAQVFGDDDWVFSNGYSEAAEGHSGDPAFQVRPWDVDATGDQGIEPSDLQWILNFQGSLTGRIVGVRYGSTVPETSGVFLNSNVGVLCSVSTLAAASDGHSLNNLSVGDEVEITVRAQVTSGARVSPAPQTNGIMQFVHDVVLNVPDVFELVSIDALAPFVVTRPQRIAWVGNEGELGARIVHGHSTSFSAGLSAPTPLYKVTLRAARLGNARVTIMPAAEAKFVTSTPHGLKVGRTRSNGNPAGATYPQSLMLSVTNVPIVPGNCDDDPSIGLPDYRCFFDCLEGPDEAYESGCGQSDVDLDQDVDLKDWYAMESAFGVP